MENILEKIIKEKKSEELARLDAIKIVNSLFSELLEREKDILSRRFGLKGDKGETLEKIGSLHKLTRERVRQIEAASVKKIKKLDNLSESVGDLKKTVSGLIAEHGGLIRRDYLLDILTVMTMELDDNNGISEAEYEQNRASYRNHFNFLISKLMSDELELVGEDDSFNASLKLKDEDTSYFRELAEDLLKNVENLKKTYSTEELIELLKQLDSYNKYQEKLKASEADLYPVFKSQVFPDKAEIINSNKVLYSLMQAVKNLEQNKYGEWGIADWQEIKPKTVNDKIYLILKHEAKPLHFTEIAKKINDMKFDRKIANAATVHNELILDSRYVLVGRGTYGLKEWSE
jgi:transcriptional regulator